ncbi:MarR family EPS-associated transcriptional regulator [Methylotenera sp.]|uniref:MarR family EPS-associated transcriptional regulator n=1 Tax=Methylotenera sp. TaxID=2051956 RepID=UPI00351FAA91
MSDFILTTPIAFILFNRPDTTGRDFAEIAKAKPSKLLVVADGARTDKSGTAKLVSSAGGYNGELAFDSTKPDGTMRKLMDVSFMRSSYERICQMLTDEYSYKILKLVEEKPDISQRELAAALGISLGKVNFCLKALIDVGLLKASNFKNSKNKLAYMYLLTSAGIEEKAKITMRFLLSKMQEYETLRAEIDDLTRDVASQIVLDQ